MFIVAVVYVNTGSRAVYVTKFSQTSKMSATCFRITTFSTTVAVLY